MKLITAIIRENKLELVRQALIDAEITRITVSRVSGHGQQIREEIYRGQAIFPNLIPKIRLEIAVNDEFVDITVDTIIQSARTNVLRSGNLQHPLNIDPRIVSFLYQGYGSERICLGYLIAKYIHSVSIFCYQTVLPESRLK